MGSLARGRMCWAVIRVARRVGGTEDSVWRAVVSFGCLCVFLEGSSCGVGRVDVELTSPCSSGLENALFGFFCCFSGHRHLCDRDRVSEDVNEFCTLI